VLSAKCCPARLSNALALWSAQLSLRDGKRLHAQYQISVLIDGKPISFQHSGGIGGDGAPKDRDAPPF